MKQVLACANRFHVLQATNIHSNGSAVYKRLMVKYSVVRLVRPRYSFSLNNYLAVSQFTLLANTRKGNKPDFHGAAKPEEARQLYDYFLSKVQDFHSAERVKNGVFQAMMEVGLVNDGPVSVNYRSNNGVVQSGMMS